MPVGAGFQVQRNNVNEDSEILAAIRSGATEPFTELVRRHQDRVFAILGRYERDCHRVEDLAQEVFLKVWRALDRFDGRVPFAHWVARIATRVALDHLRHQRRRPELALDDLGEDVLDWLGTPEPASSLSAEAARELLDVAMVELSAEERLVLTLMEIEDRNVKETSQLTGWSSVLVRVRAYRARKKLATVITELRKQTV